jgi:DNA polymerase III, epsilon subunit and related 3''-5'' exonucleases
LTAKIALLDIETAPNLGYTWGKWEQNVIAFERQWFMLSYAWKWLEAPEIYCKGLNDYKDYSKDPYSDRRLLQDLWQVFDEADIIVAHNGDAFDVKKSNARFIIHDLLPPSTYKTFDTLKAAKKHFKFESNKLGDLGEYLEVGSKLPHTGFSVWKGCMAGDEASWKTLKEYNIQDVLLLERVYLKLRPWAVGHPNLTIYGDKEGCHTCGSHNVQRRGFNYAKVQTRQRWRCNDCGSWYSGKIEKIKT